MSETIVFVSPLPALDKRLDAFGDDVSRIWQDTWVDAAPEQVIRHFVEASPDVVVIGPGVEQSGVIDWITAMEQHRPDVAVVLVADRDSDLLLSALRAGVADVIPPSVSQQELRTALDRAREVAARRSPSVSHLPGVKNRVVGVMSPKGGTGKTTIATSLTLLLAERLGDAEIGLLDLDVQFGDVAGTLGILPENSLGDAAAAARRGLDATTLKVFLTRHPSGPLVMAAPPSLVEAEEVESDHVKAVLHHFAQLFDWSIVDTAAGVNEQHLVLLEYATDLLFVCGCDLASVNALRRSMEALDMLGLVNAERHLVINQFDGRGSISQAEVESLFGREAAAVIPFSREVQKIVDAGRSISEIPLKDAGLKGLNDVVDLFAPRAEETAKAGFFRKKGR